MNDANRHDVGRAIVRREADARLETNIPRVAAIADPRCHREIGAAIIAAEDDVDDAANGIRPVDTARRGCQRLDAFDRPERNGIQITLREVAASRVRARQAPAVYQHERPLVAEPTQINS